MGINMKKIEFRYQLKLLTWQRKYQTFNTSSLNLIHNIYCSLFVRKQPKIASVTCNLHHQLERAARNFSQWSSSLKEMFAHDEI